MQRIIFRQDSKQLNRVNNISVFSGEKDVDFLEFLIPLEYNGIDLSDCNVRMSYVTGNGFEHSFLIDEYKKEELYEDEYFIYLVPVSPRFTSVEGTVNAYLSITKTVDGVEQKILKTGDVEILIRDHLSDSSQLDEEDIEIIDQVVLKAQWAVDAVNHMETEIDEKIATKTNKVFEAVMDEDNIVLDINEYPEVKINDLAVNITNTVRMWVAFRIDENDVYWSEIPTGKRVYKRDTDPQTSSAYTIATYQVGDLWIKTVDDITTAYLLTRITNDGGTPPTYHFEWLNLSDHYTKSEIDTLLNNKQNVLTTEGHLSLINDVLSTGAVKVHQYVDDNTSSYEDFENGDLLVNSNNYADKYIYRAFIDEEDDSKLIKYAISEDNIIVSTNDRPTTINDYDKNLYGKIWVKIQNNHPNPPTVINVSVCVGMNHYAYQYIELQPSLNVSGHLSKSDNTLFTDANKIYEAVMNNNVISTDPADYPNIQEKDIAIKHSASNTNHPRIWFQVNAPSSTISWVELDYSKQRVIKSENNPPTSYGGLNIGDIWIKYTTINNDTTYQIFICVNMEGNRPPYTYTWLELTGTDLSNYYTKSQVDTLLDDKQDTIQNGDGIDIEQDRIISVDLASDQDQLLKFRNGQLLLQVYDVAYDTRVRTAFTEGNNYPLASKSYVDDLMSGATKWEFVSQLPTENIDIHTIYFVPKESAETDNIYDEWVYAIQSRNPDVYDWELLGTNQVDLSNYYTKTETNNLLGNKQDIMSTTGHVNINNNVITTEANKVYTAVMKNGAISQDLADYPNLDRNDIAMYFDQGKFRLWLVHPYAPSSMAGWEEIDYNTRKVYEKTTDPITAIHTYDNYQIGDIWVKNHTDAWLLVNITITNPPDATATWISLSAGLPEYTIADEGKTLLVDSNGDADWDYGDNLKVSTIKVERRPATIEHIVSDFLVVSTSTEKYTYGVFLDNFVVEDNNKYIYVEWEEGVTSIFDSIAVGNQITTGYKYGSTDNYNSSSSMGPMYWTKLSDRKMRITVPTSNINKYLFVPFIHYNGLTQEYKEMFSDLTKVTLYYSEYTIIPIESKEYLPNVYEKKLQLTSKKSLVDNATYIEPFIYNGAFEQLKILVTEFNSTGPDSLFNGSATGISVRITFSDNSTNYYIFDSIFSNNTSSYNLPLYITLTRFGDILVTEASSIANSATRISTKELTNLEVIKIEIAGFYRGSNIILSSVASRYTIITYEK